MKSKTKAAKPSRRAKISEPSATGTRTSISKLAADPENPRTMADSNMAGLSVSLRDFGDLSGIVWNKRTGQLVAGHQRVAALTGAGVKDWRLDGDTGVVTHPETGERFRVRVVDWDEVTQRAANITANNPEIAGQWNVEAALRQMKAIEASLPDFDVLGLARLEKALAVEYEEAEREAGGGAADADEVVEPPAKPVAKLGDLWLLGDHRILCGDSTKTEDVARVMDGEKACLLNTDAPYGVDYTALKKGMPGDAHALWGDIENDTNTDPQAVQAFLELMIRTALPHLVDTTAYYFWHPMLTQGTFFAAAAAADILIHRQLIWVKPQFVLTRSGMYHWRHELCFYGWRRGNAPPWYGEKNQDTIIEAGRDDDAGQHPTQKPVKLFEIPMLNHTLPGGVCYEPFSGSGSQIIAGERLGRRVRAVELSPRYVDVAIARWELLTGGKATRA